MNYLKVAFRRLFKRGEHTPTRIISLAAGLAFGILLLSEVLYYHSFDSFYPEADQMYIVHENFKLDKTSDKVTSYGRVSGAIGPGLLSEVPGIEKATRATSLAKSVFYTEDQKGYKAEFILADENFFDLMPRKMIEGDAKSILASSMKCMISTKVAADIGRNVIGESIELKEYPGKKLTIAGIFEEVPENSNYEYDIIVPLNSISEFMWDGRENWLGNDRYYTCVKLGKGVTPKAIAPAVRKMQEKNQDILKLEQEHGDMVLKYSFEPITKMYADEVKDIIYILTAIAFAVLFVSLMNYILLSLSALIERAKSSAIHKTCGAFSSDLQRIIFSETAMLFIIALVVAALIILVFRQQAEAQIGHSLGSALTPYVILPILGLLVIIVAFISYLPARFFSRIPVALAFRHYQQKRNKWKLGLLAFQFLGATFILTVLVVVTMQYNNMKNTSHGYNTDGVYFCSTSGMTGSKISALAHELRSMPEVAKVGFGACLPTEPASGNNVCSPDGQKELFNVADLYSADENYLSILGIEMTKGEMFSEKTTARGDVIISQKGADLIALSTGWKDGVVGKELRITEHGNRMFRGVYRDFIVDSKASSDRRPSVFFYKSENDFIKTAEKYPSYSFNIVVKVKSNAASGVVNKLTRQFNKALPTNDAEVKSLALVQQDKYVQQRGFRNAMIVGNIVILIITIIGLLGYTSNEALRRRKELAIRRVNGANFSRLLLGFVTDIELIAIPAIFIGSIGAWHIASKWMENFASKITLHWMLFVGCGVVIVLLVALATSIKFIQGAFKNPVDSLRYE